MNTCPSFHLLAGLPASKYTQNFSQAMELTSSMIGFGIFAKLNLYASEK